MQYLSRVDQQLFDAVNAENWEQIEDALQKGANINVQLSLFSERSVLTEAIRREWWDGADRLLNVPGIDANAETDCGSALLFACSTHTENSGLVQRLVEEFGSDPHQSKEGIGSPLNNAAGRGHLNVACFLLEWCNCDPNAVIDDYTMQGTIAPLHKACSNGRPEMIALLLRYGANIHATSMVVISTPDGRDAVEGMTPLMLAAYEIDLRSVQLLLKHGARLEDRNSQGRNALHVSVTGFLFVVHDAWARLPYSLAAVIRELVSHGADILTARDSYGMTPLDVAFSLDQAGGEAHNCLLAAYREQLMVQHRTLAIHAILRDAEYLHSASTQDENDFHAPLHPIRVRLPIGTLTFAAFWQFLESFDAHLLRSRDIHGDFPIHLAASQGAPAEILRILLELDPGTIHIPNSAGVLPLHCFLWRERCTDLDTLRFLVGRGGDGTLTARDHTGALPLHILLDTRNGQPELKAVEFLVNSFPESLQMCTRDGKLPFVVASMASCSSDVLFVLLKAQPLALAQSTTMRRQVDQRSV